jgi:hypothetical protein
MVYKSQNHSLALSMNRNSSGNRNKLIDKLKESSLDPGKSITTEKSASNSMSRMIRSSPKIHLKHHIGHTASKTISTNKNTSLTKNFQNKLQLNRLSLEKKILDGDGSRNQKLIKKQNFHVIIHFTFNLPQSPILTVPYYSI